MAGNGWTEEERTRQANRIRKLKPWQNSTGPCTEAGKQRSSQNAVKHGAYSGDLEKAQKLVREAWRA